MTERTPVLVGIGQRLQRVDDPAEAQAPLELMIAAVRAAAADAGAPTLLAKASAVRVIKGIWGYKNPALALAESLGCGAVETAVCQSA